MQQDGAAEKQHYVIPARTISGSAQDVLEEIDDMMDALRLVREQVVARTSTPAWTPARWTRWVGGAGVVLLTVGIGFAVDPDPPFPGIGILVAVVGLVCFLVAGWIDFRRKGRR